MRVFHFMRKEHAIQNVKKSRLKIATLNDMNDPYEFYLRFESATEQEIRDFKNHYNNKAGFLCFSRRLGNPVQWANYAENHRGICMEFEMPDKLFMKVRYLKYPTLISRKNASWRKDLVNATLCKYRGWQYEREYRILIDLEADTVVKENGLYFIHFSNEFIPSKIYTGIRCELSEEETNIFKDNDIPIVKMVQDINSYAIVQA